MVQYRNHNPQSNRRAFMLQICCAAPLLANRAVAGQTNPRFKYSVPRDYATILEAYNALPENGGTIEISRGIYREKLSFSKPNIKLIGLGRTATDVQIVWGDSAKIAGGTAKSASFSISGDYFSASNLCIANDYHLNDDEPSQAVALLLTSNFAVLKNVHLLGAQDTLYAASKRPNEPCNQYFKNCYVEGHVDFIFGNALAYFDKCHINFIKKDGAFITAHSRNSQEESSAYIFNECRITSENGAKNLYLGRAWRPYARVAFINCVIDANLHSQRWREWNPGRTETYRTAQFMEYGTTGSSSDLSGQIFWAKRLSPSEAQEFKIENVFTNLSWLSGQSVKN